MSVVGLALVKQFLNITDGSNDAELQATVDRAEAILARRVGSLTPVTIVDERHVGPGPLLLKRHPVISVSSVTSGSVAVTDWDLDGDVLHGSFYAGYPARVTYVAGRPVIPADLEQAVLELVGHLWQSQRVPGANRVQAFARQSEQDVQVGAGFLLPYRVQTLIEPYQLPTLA
jgi:hypothetical protein